MPVRPGFRIVVAGPGHVPGIVDCHVAAFPGQFLTLLGRPLLSAYYAFYVAQPGAINLVAEAEGGAVLGFVNGGAPELRDAFKRQQVPRFVATILVQAARDRRVLRRLAVHVRGAGTALLRRLGWPVPPSDEPERMDPSGTWSVLVSIGVRPEAGGRGIGRALMDGFRRASADRGFASMHLSVHNDNAAAIKLYSACGWKVIRVTPGGTYFRRDVRD